MRALATTPVGEFTGDSAFKTEPDTSTTSAPLPLQAIDDGLLLGGGRTANRDLFDDDARVGGLAEQMPAVEQHQRSGAARELAKLLDDGMLTAGDHVISIMLNGPAAGRA